MPELPEVETIKRDLGKVILNLKVLDVRISDGRVVSNKDPRKFIKALKGRTFSRILRRGKALVFAFREDGYLVVQPMMTGQLIYGKPLSTAKVRFYLSDGQTLNYNDQRTFGRLQFVEDLNEIKYLQSLGLDPLGDDFHPVFLKAALAFKKTPIKSLLMNQGFVAGIGNIYASEILFTSRIHPERPANSLSDREMDSLYQATLAVLKEAVELRGTSMHTYRDLHGQKGKFLNRLKVYGREDQKCFRCQALISRIVQAGRSSFLCRRCQPLEIG